MKPHLKILTFLLILFASGALHAQIDTSRTQVIKVRKAENDCSLKGYKFSDYFMVIYEGGLGTGDSAVSQRWILEFGQLYSVQRMLRDGDPAQYEKATWQDDNGTFRLKMGGFRFVGQCTGSRLTGKVWEKDKLFGSFILIPTEEFIMGSDLNIDL